MFGEAPSNRQILLAIHERICQMATLDDLNASVALITTAVGDASNALKDIAAKLTAASSVQPAEIEQTAAKLNALAAGLSSVVQSVGEPVTSTAVPVTPPTGSDSSSAPAGEPGPGTQPPPIEAVEPGAAPNPPGATVAPAPAPAAE